MTELRPIAIHVVEPKPGKFSWVLSEVGSNGTSLTQLQQAQRPQATYHAAMAAGLLTLQGLVDDLDKGPTKQPQKAVGQDDPGLTTTNNETPDPPKQVVRKVGGYFGFGPVR